MMNSICCFATSEKQVDQIVKNLKTYGISHDEISVLFPDKKATQTFARQNGIKSHEGVVTLSRLGAVIGGLIGWLIGLGVLTIPSPHLFIVNDAFTAGFGGAVIGALLGCIAGALIGLGIPDPEYEAVRFEGKINAGYILISVHTEDGSEVSSAKEVFQRAGAEDIRIISEIPLEGKNFQDASGQPGSQSALAEFPRQTGVLMARKSSRLDSLVATSGSLGKFRKKPLSVSKHS